MDVVPPALTALIDLLRKLDPERFERERNFLDLGSQT